LKTLLTSGLPGHGNTVAVITDEERGARIAAFPETRGLMRQDVPAMAIVASEQEQEQEQSVHLIIQPVHFVHPSVLERKPVRASDGHGIAVSVATCANPDLAHRWVNQFSEQDLATNKALST
jgi:hypothetical protein